MGAEGGDGAVLDLVTARPSLRYLFLYYAPLIVLLSTPYSSPPIPTMLLKPSRYGSLHYPRSHLF
jgi:hypothetical protein